MRRPLQFGLPVVFVVMLIVAIGSWQFVRAPINATAKAHLDQAKLVDSVWIVPVDVENEANGKLWYEGYSDEDPPLVLVETLRGNSWSIRNGFFCGTGRPVSLRRGETVRCEARVPTDGAARFRLAVRLRDGRQSDRSELITAGEFSITPPITSHVKVRL